jgi:hypothetical protein
MQKLVEGRAFLPTFCFNNTFKVLIMNEKDDSWLFVCGHVKLIGNMYYGIGLKITYSSNMHYAF